MQRTLIQGKQQQSLPRLRWLLLGGTLALLFLAHRAVVALPITATSPLTPLARLFDLALLGCILALAHALGARLLRRAGLVGDPAEQAALAIPLGLGALASALLALGFAGFYRAPGILALVACLAALLWRDLAALGAQVPALGRWARRRIHENERLARGLTALLGLGMLLALAGALTPPHHHDPLTYHLTLPQHFLRSGEVGPIAAVGPSNVPLLAELLFGLGLGFGSEVFGGLLHWAFAALIALGTWTTARRWFGRHTATISLAILLGTPLVPIWARVANNDLAVGCFVLAALIAALRAADAPAPLARRWLALAGVFAGFALATKYQALFALAPLGLLIGFDAIAKRDNSERWRGRLRRGALHLAAFGAATVAVTLPWYWHNLPLLLGVAGSALGIAPADPGSLQLSKQYIQLVDGMLISPRTPLGYLLLPLRAYARGDFEQRFVVPSPLFLCLPLLLLVPRWWHHRALRYCLVVSLGFLVAWSLGVQELRYILAIVGPLAIATAYALRALWTRRAGRLLVRALLIVAAIWMLGLTFLHVGADRPTKVLLGLESRDAYLRQSPTVGATYRALDSLTARLQPGERALLVHELQVYYLPSIEAIRSQDARALLAILSEQYPTPEAALAYLRADRIAYIYVNEADIRWWQQGDDKGQIARAKADFDRLASGFERVYSDGPADRPNIVIYRVPPR